MTSNSEAISFLRKNLDNSDVIKIFVKSLCMAAISVGLIVGSLLSISYLLNYYDLPTLLLSIFIVFAANLYVIGLYVYDKTNPLKWNDLSLLWYNDKANYIDSSNFMFAMSFGLGIATLASAYFIGKILLTCFSIIYALFSSINFAGDSLFYTALLIGLSIALAAIRIRYKWQDDPSLKMIIYNIALAIIFVTICFVCGGAIGRIAGYIGIEYTICLVSSYIVFTIIYMIQDLRTWMTIKARESQN